MELHEKQPAIIRSEEDGRLIIEQIRWKSGLLLGALVAVTLAVVMIALVPPAAEGGVAAAGVLVGAALSAALFVRHQVICDAASRRITLRRRGLFGQECRSFGLEQVIGAGLERDRITPGGIETARPVLLVRRCGAKTGRGAPIIESFAADPGPVRIVNAINQWLDSARGGK